MENNPSIYKLTKIKLSNQLRTNLRAVLVLFFIGIIAFGTTANAQKTIELKMENVTLKEILNAIERKSNYIFIYNSISIIL